MTSIAIGEEHIRARTSSRRWASAARIARQNRLGVAAGFVVVVYILAAALAPWLAPYDYNDQGGAVLAGPTADHWLGTDHLGRDLFSRVLYGARVSVFIAFGSVIIGCIGGLVIGTISGFVGGWLDDVLQRLVDAMMVLPTIVLALVLINAIGTDLSVVVIAVGVVMAPRLSRVVRASVLSVRPLQFVEAARTIGASPLRVAVLHVLPSVIPPMLVVTSSFLASAVLIEATLSFLGLGVQPPTPSWGTMLSGSSRTYMFSNPWLAVPAGAALSGLILSLNLLGDAVRDALDPKLRRRS